MHHGHSAPITYRLWVINQTTKPNPNKAPRLSPSQTQRGSSTLDTSSTPIEITTLYPMRPMIGLGKPKADACSVMMTEPQDSTGLMSHPGM